MNEATATEMAPHWRSAESQHLTEQWTTEATEAEVPTADALVEAFAAVSDREWARYDGAQECSVCGGWQREFHITLHRPNCPVLLARAFVAERLARVADKATESTEE